jgi:hypothetical protein
MTYHTFDDPLKELEAALAVEPSPAFAARVRARVAETRSRPVWLGWQGIAAAAVVVLAVVGVVAWHVRAGDARNLPHRAAVESAGVPVAGIGVPVHVDRATPVARVPAIEVPSVRTAVVQTPEVLVPSDQAMALNRLLAGLRERRATAAAAAEAPLVLLEELPQISPVRLEPIKIDPLVPNSPPSGGKEKDR